jgi:hypothetical protein
VSPTVPASGDKPVLIDNPDVIEQLWQAFASLGDLESNVIEVGERSPEETAGLLARLWEGALLLSPES